MGAMVKRVGGVGNHNKVVEESSAAGCSQKDSLLADVFLTVSRIMALVLLGFGGAYLSLGDGMFDGSLFLTRVTDIGMAERVRAEHASVTPFVPLGS